MFPLPGIAMVVWPFIKSTFVAIIRPFLDPANWIGLAVLVAAVYGYAWFKGDAHGDRQCETRIARDRAEQDRKIREAGETTMIAIDRWLSETEKANELEIQLAIEASKDPAAKHACIGLDGRVRINRFTRKPRG